MTPDFWRLQALLDSKDITRSISAIYFEVLTYLWNIGTCRIFLFFVFVVLVYILKPSYKK